MEELLFPVIYKYRSTNTIIPVNNRPPKITLEEDYSCLKTFIMNHLCRKGFSSYLLIALVTTLIFTGCKNEQQTEIISTNFGEIIDRQQNLEFTFKSDIVSDTLVELWDTTKYLSITPNISGRYKWTNKNTLIFSPLVPFAPNTDYTAVITDKVSRLSNKKISDQNTSYNFHTPYLTIENSYAFWSRNEQNTQEIELHIRIIFNYPVLREDIQKYIQLDADSKTIPFIIRGLVNSNESELIIKVNPENLNYSNLNIIMLPGIKTQGSDRTETKPLSFAVSIPESDKLEITDVVTSFEGGTGVITIHTTQPIKSADIAKYISLDPGIEYKIALTANGFRITGDFKDGTSYKLTLKKGIKGIFDTEIQEDIVNTVTFGSLKPYIAFLNRSDMYLTSAGEGNIGINIINVPEVKVTVFKVFENNIQHYMRSGRNWEWFEGDDEYYDSYNYTLNDDYGKVISSATYSTNALPKSGNVHLLKINPADLDLKSDLKGIFLIKVEAKDKKWLNDVQLLSFSDIGLIVKQSANDLFVAARSIASAKPIEGVSIGLYSKNNQLINRFTTNRDGVILLNDFKNILSDYTLAMITATKGIDYNVLLLNNSAVEMSRFDVGGKRTRGLDYDAYIYGDRNLYRPGDSVYCNVILRDFGVKTIKDFPIIFRVISPDGKDFLKRRLSLNDNGSAETAFELPFKANTGTYICEILTLTDTLIGNYSIKVEEFMPDRISVDVKSDKKKYESGDEAKFTITAMNLFGPPAANRKVENELRITKKNFSPKDYPNRYNFTINSSESINYFSEINQTTTSANGTVIQTFKLPKYEAIGALNGRLYTTVFDETGRPVNRITNFEIITQKQYLGIGLLPGWLQSDRPINIDLIALDLNEKPTQSKARMDIILSTWETVLERNYGQTRYISQKKERLIQSKEVYINGKHTESYIPRESGEYIIRVSLPGSNSWVEERFYAYTWGGISESNFKIDKDGKIDITLDKDTYQIGQEAKVLFKTPFSGEMIVTVEQNKTFEYYSISSDEKGATLKLKIKDEFFPNIYISATLIRKASASSIPLTVAHGYANVNIDKPSLKLPVIIDAPQESRSDKKQTIKVKTSPGAEVTIAVVDQGILQITDYKTPAPFDYFYARRALEVDSYDLFDELLPELSRNSLSTGGDQGFDIGKRLNPLTSKRVKLLSLWSKRLRANSKGEVTFIADIPKFSGAVRIMAVASKDNLFGTGESYIKIADPITISSSIPRFLSPDDNASIAVTLTNTTAVPMDVKVSVKTSGKVTAQNIDRPMLRIAANSEASINYHLLAQSTIGNGKIKLIAETTNETFSDETEISVRPPVPYVKIAKSGIIKNSEELKLSTDNKLHPESSTSRLMITRNPAGQYADLLEGLINYPHGCIEQVISSAFPQIFYADLSRMLKKSKGSTYNINDNIKEAIRRISSSQLYNGSIVTWPGYDDPNWWNTAYAAHFLYEADRAGYTIDTKVQDYIHKFLLEQVKQKNTKKYYYWTGDSYIERVEASHDIFYSLYVLALSGKHHLPTMNYFKSHPDLLSLQSKYLLALTYKLTGDQKSYNALLPTLYNETPASMNSGSYDSPIRNKALILYTLASVDPDNQQIIIMSKQLGEMLRAAKWLNTQERVFSVLALGKLAGNNKNDDIKATVFNNNKTTPVSDNDFISEVIGNVTIKTTGTGTLYWFLETEGLPINNKVQIEDRILKVRRQIFTRAGKLVSGTLKQNDLLVIAVSISTTDNSVIENTVISDLLPACFEIENSRLTAERDMPWIIQRSIPDYFDLRDDRALFYTTASGKPKTFYYMVRVVNKGTYKYAPIGAEAMYNGQYYSYWGDQTLKVE